MITTIKHIYATIVLAGVDEEKDYGEIRKIKFLNFTCFISSIIALISCPVLIFNGSYWITFFYFIWALVLMMFIYLNSINKSRISRVAFITILLIYEWYTIHYLNKIDFREYYLILNILVSFILFDSLLFSGMLFFGLAISFYGQSFFSYEFFTKAIRLSAFFVVSAFLKSVILNVEEVIKIKSRETAEAENARLREQQEKVKAELAHKNAELVNFAVQITQKNDLIETLNKKVKAIGGSDLKELKEILKANQSILKDREEFENHVQNVYEGFYARLVLKYPDLTNNEKKLAALIRLNLSSKEMSTIMNISPKSVDQSRYRLRQKMQLETSESLSDILQSI